MASLTKKKEEKNMFHTIENAQQKILKGLSIAIESNDQENIDIGIEMNLSTVSRCANNLKNVDLENLKWIGD